MNSHLTMLIDDLVEHLGHVCVLLVLGYQNSKEA